MKKIISMLFATILVLGFTSSANAAKTLKCQTVLNTKADEVKMLKDFTDTVTEFFDQKLIEALQYHEIHLFLSLGFLPL